MNKKVLIPLMLFVPGILAACGKTPEEKKDAEKKAKDLIKLVQIDLDFEEGEDTYISSTNLSIELPPTEGDVTLSTEIKVDKEKNNRVVSGCTYSIVGTYDEDVVSLTNNILHLKDAVTITLKTSFAFKDTKETVSKQFTVAFSLPDVLKVKMTRATLDSLSNYGLDFSSTNGFPSSVSDEESLCEMSGNGSYGFSNYAKLERLSKVTFEFKRLGTFSSTEVWGTKYDYRNTYVQSDGDIRISKNNSDVDESGNLVVDFAEKVSYFTQAPYCFQCWFWNNSALSEESALIKSITIEYVPFVEAE